MAAEALIRGWSEDRGMFVLVTHQVNITALTKHHSAEGEILVLRVAGNGTIAVLGRIPAPS